MSHKVLPLLAVVLAATVPYLTTLNGYFLADDFGLYQLFSQKPWWHALTLFHQPWWEEIYGFRGDELRPTLAFSYQLDWWISGTQPWAGHAFNIILHVLCSLLVYAMARAVAHLDLWPSAFAGALFGVMAVHAEPVAWISGRADSIPTLFYLAAIVSYARWRTSSWGRPAHPEPVEGRADARWYFLSILAFFGALFSKQSAITLLPALVFYDLLCHPEGAGAPVSWGGRTEGPPRQSPRRWRLALSPLIPYLPFGLMTIAYLALRLNLFGNAVREQAITWERIEVFWERQQFYLQALAAGVESLDGGLFSTGLAVVTLVLVGAGALAGRRWLYLVPAWWIVTVGPMAVTYFSMRHLYLTSTGIAVAAALGCHALWTYSYSLSPRAQSSLLLRAQYPLSLWERVRVRAPTFTSHPGRHLALVLGAAVLLGQTGSLSVHVGRWNQAGMLSAAIARDLEREALSLPPGSLIVLGAPPGGGDPRRWTWVWGMSLPFAMEPPFMPTQIGERVSVISRAEIYCCGYLRWQALTRNAVADWAARTDRPPVIALVWDLESLDMIRRSDAALEEQVLRLRDAPTPGDVYNGVDAILRPMGGTGAQFRLN